MQRSIPTDDECIRGGVEGSVKVTDSSTRPQLHSDSLGMEHYSAADSS